MAWLGAASLAVAVDYTWTGGGGATWDTSSANWSGGGGNYWTSATGTGNRAFFNTAGATAAVSGTVFTNGVVLQNTGTISGGTISLGGVAPTIDVLASGSGSLLSSVLAGTSGVRFTNSAGAPGATLVLGPSASTVTGGVTIGSGVTVQTGGTNQFGSHVNAATVNGGLVMAQPQRLTSVSGSGAISIPNGGQLRISSGTSAWSGVMSGGGNIIWDGPATLNFTGDNQTTGQWVLRNLGTLILGSTTALKTTSSMKVESADVPTIMLAAGDQRFNTTNLFLNNLGAGTGLRLGASGAGRQAIWTGVSTTGTAAAAPLSWTGGGFGSVGTTLGFGGPLATHTLTWVSPIDLSGTAGAVRSFEAINGSAAVAGDIIGSIGDSGAPKATFQKTGAGTLRLSGSNSFAGPTVLSAGVLQLGNANALASTGTITFGGGVLEYGANNAVDYSSRITSSTGAIAIDTGGQAVTFATALAVSNTAGLTKSGSGSLLLSAANAYLGPTTVSSGTLRIGVGGTTGSIVSTSAVSIGSGGVVVFDRSDDYGGTLANVISGSGRLVLTSGSLVLAGNNTFSGTTQILGGVLSVGTGTNVGSLAGAVENAGSLVFNRSDAVSFGGLVSGTGTLVKRGAGTLTLSGSNTFSGKTTLVGGGLSVNSIGSVNGGASALGNPDSIANGTIDIGGGSTLTYTGSTATSDRVINLGLGAASANFNHSGSGRLTLSGSVNVGVTSSWGMQATNAASELVVSGLVSGSGANGLFLNQSGTTAFTNPGNSFTGNLTIFNGTLVASSIANSGSASAAGAGANISFGHGGFNMFGRLVFTGSAGGASNRTIAIAGGSSGTTVFTNGGILENAVAGQTLTLSGNVTATGSTPSFELTGAGNGVLSGAISDGAGDLSIRKTGAGTWTLTGSNTFSGSATVSQGSLVATQVASLGASPSITVAAGAGIGFANASSGTFSSVLTGAGGLVKTGAGLLALTGSNGLTGATAIDGGTLSLGSANALAGGGSLSFGGGTLQFGPANTSDVSARIVSSTGAVAIDTNGQTVVFASALDASNTGGTRKAGAGTLRLTNAAPGLTGPTTITGGTLELAASSGTVTLAGSLLGSGGVFARSGGGTTIISGTGNSFAGALSVTGGLVQIGTATTSNVGSQGLASVSSITVGPGADLVLKNSTAINSAAPIALSGTLSTDVAGVSGGGFANYLGALSMNGGSLVANTGANATNFQSYAFTAGVTVTGSAASRISAAPGSVGNGIHLTHVAGGMRTIDVADVTASNSADLIVSAALVNATSTGSASGLMKTGLGTMLISSTSTYSGATQVAAGALVVNGRLANTSGVTVDAGATLGGSGVIAALATVNGTLSPGNSPGELTLASLALGANATTLIEVTGTARGSHYDGITITQAGGLSYGGTLALDFASLLGDDTTLDIFSFTGTPTGSFASVTSSGAYAGSWTNNQNGTYSLEQGSQTLTFSQLSGDVIIVPEPTAIALAAIGLAGAGVAASRRRGRR